MLKRRLKKNKDVTELLAQQEERLEQIEKSFAAIEPLEDEVEKIVRLERLIRDINKAGNNNRRNRNLFSTRRSDIGAAGGASTGAVVGTVAVGAATVVFCPPLAPLTMLGMMGFVPGLLAGVKMSEKKAGKLIDQEPYLSYGENILAAQESRAQEAFDNAVADCDLEKLPLSLHFKEALSCSTELNDRFTKAATDKARQTIEGKAEQEDRPSAPKLRTGNSASRPTLRK